MKILGKKVRQLVYLASVGGATSWSEKKLEWELPRTYFDAELPLRERTLFDNIFF